MLLLLGAAVTLPQEDDSLTNKHTDGAGGQTSQNTEDGGNNNEANNAGESVGEGTVVRTVHVVVRGTTILHLRVEVVAVVVGVVTLGAELVIEGGRRGERRHALGVEAVVTVVLILEIPKADEAFITVVLVVLVALVILVVVALGTELAVLASAALLATHTHNAVLGSRHKSVDTVEQQLLETLGIAVALLPGHLLGGGSGLLDVTIGEEQIAVGGKDEGQVDGVDRNRLALQVENSEANIQNLAILLIGMGLWCHLQGVTGGHGAGFDVASFDILSNSDGAGRARGEDLMVVGQQAVFFDVEVEELSSIH